MKNQYESDKYREEQDVKNANVGIMEKNLDVKNAKINQKLLSEEIESLQERIDAYKTMIIGKENRIVKLDNWLNDNVEKELVEPKEIPEPEYSSTKEIEEKISNAKADEIRYTQYQSNLLKQEEKEHSEEMLRAQEELSRKLKQNKILKLKEVSSNTGIEGFRFDSEGIPMYENASMDMLSTSQLMQLKTACMSLLPNGIGLELIDRAESLGRDIYRYIDIAKKENKTILATIVGEKPAKVDEEIGVFVVDDGKVENIQ